MCRVTPCWRAISPAASSANVVNAGVKQGRNASSSSVSNPGSLLTRSIGGTFCEGFYGTTDASSIPGKITPAHRIERTFR
jgi:hypothetical protein